MTTVRYGNADARELTCNKTVGNCFHISYHCLGIYSDDLSFCDDIIRPFYLHLLLIGVFILGFVSSRNDGFAEDQQLRHRKTAHFRYSLQRNANCLTQFSNKPHGENKEILCSIELNSYFSHKFQVIFSYMNTL